jgi:hypothetical protein
VFAIASDGLCYRASCTSLTLNRGWTGKPNGGGENWTRLAGGGKFPPGGPIVAVSRSPAHLDIFAIGADGDIWGAWTAFEGTSSSWWSLNRPAGSPPLTERCKIAAAAVGERDYDIFVCGEREGDIWTRHWDDEIQPWIRITAPTPPPNAPLLAALPPPSAALSAVKSRYGECDVFAVFDNGEAFVSWTSGGRQPQEWHAFDSQGGSLHPGSPVIAVLDDDNVDSSTIRLFGINTDHTVVTTTTTPRSRTTPPPWVELGAKGQFPPGTQLAVVASGWRKHHLYGVAHDGTVLTTDVVEGKAGAWQAIGGNGRVKFCHASGGVRPLKHGQQSTTPSIQAEIMHRDIKLSGAGFTPFSYYQVVLRHCVDPAVQQEFAGGGYVVDRAGRLSCTLPVLNVHNNAYSDDGWPVISKRDYTLEIKIACEGGQAANTFVRVPGPDAARAK